MRRPFSYNGNVQLVAIVGMMVVIIGCLFWIYVQNMIMQPISISENDSSSTTSATKTLTGNPKTRLEQLYDKYITALTANNSQSLIQEYVNGGYILDNFTIYPSSDPLLCGIEDKPDKVSIRLINQSTAAATLYVTKLYNDGHDASSSITATMSGNNKNVWALEKIKCL